MEIIDNIYYKDYENLLECAIEFSYENIGNKEILYIWEGYFDSIMHGIPFKNESFYGLVKEYQQDTGWYDEKWQIPDLDDAINQLNHFDVEILKLQENNYDFLDHKLLYEVLERIVQFLERAKKLNCKVYMDVY